MTFKIEINHDQLNKLYNLYVESTCLNKFRLLYNQTNKNIKKMQQIKKFDRRIDIQYEISPFNRTIGKSGYLRAA